MLKKAITVAISIFLIVSIFLLNRVPTFDKYNYAKEYEVYLTSYSSPSQIIKVDKNSFKFVLGVKGEGFKVDKESFCLVEFLSQIDAELVLKEELENVVCYYAYSKNIKYLEMIKGRLINLHIAVGENYVKVGAPIIYGSF